MRLRLVIVGACFGVMAAAAACVGDSSPPVDGGQDVASNETSTNDVTSDAPPKCDAGTVACGSACVDTQTDKANCGTCGHACGTSFSCTTGVCGDHVEAAARGNTHICILLHDGSVWCRGQSNSMQLGTDGTGDPICPGTQANQGQTCKKDFAKVANLAAASHIAAAGNGTCAVTAADGKVWCWGDNESQQLGHITNDPSSPDKICPDTAFKSCIDTPTLVAGLPPDPVQQISMSETFTCVATKKTSGGDVYCWGASTEAQLGPDTVTPGYAPHLALSGAIEVATSQADNNFAHACALTTGSQVMCWGANSSGQLGHPSGTGGDTYAGIITKVKNGTPSAVQGITTTPKHLSTGSQVSCMVDTVGGVFCWGSNGSNIIGNNTATPDGGFGSTKVSVTTAIDTLAGHASHICAVGLDHSVWCWGSANFGEVGTGQYHDNLTNTTVCPGFALGQPACIAPTKLNGVTGGTSTVQNSASVLVAQDDTVWGWGADNTQVVQPADGGIVPCSADGGGYISGNCIPTPRVVTGIP